MEIHIRGVFSVVSDEVLLSTDFTTRQHTFCIRTR